MRLGFARVGTMLLILLTIFCSEEKGTFYFVALVRGRPRGRSVNSRRMRSVVVILVKQILPRFAAVQNVVANPSDGSSCGSWQSARLP